ncbi:MAG: hypothetical protein AAGA41_04520 [Pseudomonadota bacterium]
MHVRALWLIAILSGLVAGCRAEPVAAPVTAPARLALPAIVGPLDYSVLPEVSGMAASPTQADTLWIVNDSGNRAEIIALSVPDMGTQPVRVVGALNRDWEDLASFTLDDNAWLMIADVGDNNANRSRVSLHFLREPDTTANTVARATTVEFTYSDGPRDVEAVAVDAARDTIYLLSKRTKPPVLYSLPLRAAMAASRNGDRLTAQRLGAVTTIPAPTALELRLSPRFGKFRDQPTAMDLSPDGRVIALLTYGEAYRAAIDPGESWLDALNSSLEPLGMPVLKQPETIAWAADGSLYASSEQRGAPLIHWRADEH